MRNLGLLAVILLTSASIAGAGFHPAFQEGEDLTFQIRWGVITGGYATLSVPSIDLIEGKSAYHILSQARSTGWRRTSQPRARTATVRPTSPSQRRSRVT